MNNHNPRKTGSGRSSGNSGVIIGILIVVLVLINYKLFSMIITKNPESIHINPNNNVKNEQTEAEKALAAIEKDIANNFISLSVSEDDTKSGNLILVNNSHAFSFDASPVMVKNNVAVSFYGRQSDKYIVSYPSRETLMPEALEALNSMMEDFYANTGLKNVLLVDSYRSFEDQQRIYEEKGGDIATLPGHSEHHTNLAFDFDIYGGGEFDGSGEYAWISQNCHKYGYILRYAEDKTAITGISYEPWHFRYVGKEHAYFMHENNLCLEEYVELLSKYPIGSARLSFTTDSGESYTVYSSSVAGKSGEIKVPKNYSYTLSGDNNGHVIVSYMTSVPDLNTEV